MSQSSKSDTETGMNIVDINAIINLAIPHIGEQIFEGLEMNDQIQCLKVSETWKIFAGKILMPKWKGKLLKACREGKTQIVEVLLDNLEDADEVTALDGRGKTALILACEYGHTDLVRLLLDHPRSENISINAKDNYEETALIHACCNGCKDVVKVLLDHPRSENIDINAKNRLDKTAYDYARGSNYSEIVQLLEEYSKSRGIELS